MSFKLRLSKAKLGEQVFVWLYAKDGVSVAIMSIVSVAMCVAGQCRLDCMMPRLFLGHIALV